MNCRRVSSPRRRRLLAPLRPNSRRNVACYAWASTPFQSWLLPSWYHGTLVPMSQPSHVVERVQTGVRIEKRLLKVLKALAAYHELSLGDLLEGIVLHAFDGKCPFQAESLARIRELKNSMDSTWTRGRAIGSSRQTRHKWRRRGRGSDEQPAARCAHADRRRLGAGLHDERARHDGSCLP